MLFSRREVNVWPGFSDIMFMLAVSTLVVAGAVVMAEREQAKTLAEWEAKLIAYGIDLKSKSECGRSTPVIEQLRACLERKGIKVRLRGCSIEVENAVLFDSRSSVLSSAAREKIERFAPCITDAAKSVAEMPRSGIGLDSIVIEGHSDRCGYENWQLANDSGMGLAALRAQAVYNVVFEQLIKAAGRPDAGPVEPLLARITTRSLGPYRPVSGAECTCDPVSAGCEADRRVEIVVQGRVGKAEEPWAPPSRIPFLASKARARASSSPAKDTTP